MSDKDSKGVWLEWENLDALRFAIQEKRYHTAETLVEAWIHRTRPAPKEEWISVETTDLTYLITKLDRGGSDTGKANALKLAEKYFPSPPTKDQTEKKCDNPHCYDGFVTRQGVDEVYHIKCPDCQPVL